MTNFKKLCAFTLSELLLALTIVGVIAVLTVPVIVGNVQKKLFATKLKNTVTMIEQVAQQEMIRHHTRNLMNTDFSDPEKLLSDKHFSIAKICPASTASRDCWKTTATGKNKVVYRRINKAVVTINAGYTVILKNGIMLRYTLDNLQGIVGIFYIDINGNDKPNILGHDTYSFYITNKGFIVDKSYLDQKEYSLSERIDKCKNISIYYCYGALVNSGWKMDY